MRLPIKEMRKMLNFLFTLDDKAIADKTWNLTLFYLFISLRLNNYYVHKASVA